MLFVLMVGGWKFSFWQRLSTGSLLLSFAPPSHKLPTAALLVWVAAVIIMTAAATRSKVSARMKFPGPQP